MQRPSCGRQCFESNLLVKYLPSPEFALFADLCTCLALPKQFCRSYTNKKKWKLFKKEIAFMNDVCQNIIDLQLQSVTTHVVHQIPSIFVADKGLHNLKKKRPKIRKKQITWRRFENDCVKKKQIHFRKTIFNSRYRELDFLYIYIS